MVIIPIVPIEQMKFNKMEPTDIQGTNIPFANVLKDAMQGYEEVKAVTSEDAYRLVLGDVDDITQMQTNSLKLNAMVETTVQLTTRMVNAYKEILQMQV